MGIFSKLKELFYEDEDHIEKLGLMTHSISILMKKFPKKFPKKLKYYGEINGKVIEMNGNFKIKDEEKYPIELNLNGRKKEYILIIRKVDDKSIKNVNKTFIF